MDGNINFKLGGNYRRGGSKSEARATARLGVTVRVSVWGLGLFRGYGHRADFPGVNVLLLHSMYVGSRR